MYQSPINEYSFLLENVVDAKAVLNEAENNGMSLADFRDVFTTAAEFATEVVHPLNAVADQEGVQLRDGVATTASGYRQAYQSFVEAGWQGVGAPADAGGEGLPHIFSHALDELWSAGGAAFSLVKALTSGAIEAISAAGDDWVKSTFLPAMVEGRWTGTMNLTESQAGTDLAAVRTMARPQDDGTWSVKGQKIFITWGDHDLAENIVHLVLARTPDAPAGHAGLSLFAVPKYLVNSDGSLGERNSVTTVSLERKLGIHGSATCVLEYEDATGYLVGERNAGLASMFVMMNASRVGVGVQSTGVADRAYQIARDYADERVQGTPLGRDDGTTIIGHPDVARLVLSMASRVTAMRALTVQVSVWMDASRASKEARSFADFFAPIAKGWSSESAVQIASDAVQVHGGSGFIEETGIALYYRDSRILPIYEGTTAIQANDLIGRKILRDRGEVAQQVLALMSKDVAPLREADDEVGEHLASRLQSAIQTMQTAVENILSAAAKNPRDAFAASVPMLLAWGDLAGLWLHARIVTAALANPDEQTARRVREAKSFNAQQMGVHLGSLLEIIETGDLT